MAGPLRAWSVRSPSPSHGAPPLRSAALSNS